MTYIKKPVFTPAAKIRKSLYTEGLEYSYAETFEEYRGLYHVYPNGASYTEAVFLPNISEPLIPYVVQGEQSQLLDMNGRDNGSTTVNNSLYYQITEARFNNHYTPPYFYPNPLPRDYDLGYFSRIFVQKINDTSDITEISPDESSRMNRNNTPGIDSAIYKKVILEWTINGPIDAVRIANRNTIAFAARTYDMNGLVFYLSDLDEFHKDYHKIPE